MFSIFFKYLVYVKTKKYFSMESMLIISRKMYSYNQKISEM